MVRTGYLELPQDVDRSYFDSSDLATTFFYQVKQGGETHRLELEQGDDLRRQWALFRILLSSKIPV